MKFQANQTELKLNVSNQLLACADINLFGEKIYTMKKNTNNFSR
jgi:hypothetical protein